MNKTSTFVLNSDSLGPNVNLEFSRSKPYSQSNRFGRMTPYILISEDYAGRQRMSLKVGMNESAIIPLEDKYEWIPCCDWENQSYFDGYTDIRKIFDCTCFKSIKWHSLDQGYYHFKKFFWAFSGLICNVFELHNFFWFSKDEYRMQDWLIRW